MTRRVAFGLYAVVAASFGLGSCATPFVLPRTCALIAGGFCLVGALLSVGALTSIRDRLAIIVGLIGLAGSFGVLALPMWVRSSPRHLIDLLEREHGYLLQMIGGAPVAGTVLFLAVLFWPERAEIGIDGGPSNN